MYLLCGINTLYTQNKTIKGIVTDSDVGTPLIGVFILVKDTTIGVTTDFDGNYTLNNVAPNATLVFSYIGYKNQEVNVTGKTTINIALIPDLEVLDEVVIIDDDTTKKSDLTDAVVPITGSNLKEQPNPNVSEALSDRLTGVQVTSSEESPDSEIKIRIRGGTP